MNIYIPTLGRVNLQRTLLALPPGLRERATLVVSVAEEGSHRARWPRDNVLATDARGIAATRQWILETRPEDHLVMLDDDLAFFVKDEKRKIIAATSGQIEHAFHMLQEWLQAGILHCGVTVRSLNWQHPGPAMSTTRLMHVLAYNRPAVLAAGCSFTAGVDPDFSMDDFHMTLQLLERGHDNRLLVDFCTSPSASNSRGGASTWRTLETQNRSAQHLHDLHKEFVAVRIKQNWQGMNGERKDVTVQWRKAYGKGKDVHS